MNAPEQSRDTRDPRWFGDVFQEASGPAVSLGMFRMIVGFVGLFHFLPRAGHVREIYSHDSLFHVLPAALEALIWALLVCLLAVAIGFFTRIASWVGFGLIGYFAWRSVHGPGWDEYLLLVAVLLCALGPGGRAWSADRLLARFRTGGCQLRLVGRDSEHASTRALHLLALLLCSIYVTLAVQGIVHGAAGYRLGPILIELSLPFGLLIRPARLIAAAVGVLFHLGSAVWTPQSPLFGSLCVASYLAFVPPADVEAFLVRLRQRVGRQRHAILYDGACPFCNASVSLLLGLDVLGFLRPIDFRSTSVLPAGFSPDRLENEMGVATEAGGVYYGFAGVRRLAWTIPAIAWLAPLLYLPGVGPGGSAVYRFIARHRYKIVRCGPQACDVP